MLLKYLNDLDRAIRDARERPGPEQYGHCVQCADRLVDYLNDQVEPLRRRGLEIMAQLLPERFDDWVSQWQAYRQAHSQFPLAM